MTSYFVRLTPEALENARQKVRDRYLPPVSLSHTEIEAARLRIAGVPLPTAQPRADLKALCLMMVDLINQDRRVHSEESHRARPVAWHEGAARVAQAHSEDMLRRKFMAHINLEGLGPAERLLAGGIRFGWCGENLAGSAMRDHYTGYPTVEAAERALMDEPPNEPNHRSNILNHNFTHVGIGIAVNPDRTLIITQDFIGL